jgi:D-glycero-D-manno-heptose 1,7-bisphosphate phosphatase
MENKPKSMAPLNVRAVLLDRDGTINELVYDPELGLVDSPLNPEQFKLIPGAAEAIRSFNEIGIKVIIVSNQPAVAKGKMTMELFEEVRIKMKSLLKKAGAHIDGEYYCLHHPEARLPEFRSNCECRKPKPGLLLRAARDFNLNLKECFMIGDGITDIMAGQAVGCRTILIGRLKCDLCRLMDDLGVKPDHIVPNLNHASEIVRKEAIGSGRDIP